MEEIRAKTPLFFQEALAKEIRKITLGMRFRQPKNKEFISLKVHNQMLPVPMKKQNSPDVENENRIVGSVDSDLGMQGTIDYINETEEDAVFDCPWCLIKLVGGRIPGINQKQEIDVAVCFGIFNDSPTNQGHQEILNLIQKTYERFATNPLLDGQYTCSGNFEWVLQEEDTFPYFFGAISMKFSFWGFRRENKFT